MLAVAIRVEQAYGDSLGAVLPDSLDGTSDGSDVQLGYDTVVCRQPLVDLQAQAARDQGRRQGVVQAEQFRNAQPAQFQDVAKAFRSYQGGLRALVLQDGVRGYGRAVHCLTD